MDGKRDNFNQPEESAMRWTVGMPSYKNFTEVWFTVQALRMYHDDIDMEIVIVDNYGDLALAEWARKDGNGQIVYDKFTSQVGVSPAKNRIFEIARGDNVLVIDSHILVAKGALSWDIPDDGLYQGPLIRGSRKGYMCEWLPQWRSRMWGIWGPAVTQLPEKRFPIWAQGAGFFACRREAWLGFNKDFRGFGGETGYVQEKWRRNGRQVWCEPRMVWQHFFNSAKLGGRAITYPLQIVDRVRNYIIGYKEIGLDTKPIREHFGKELYQQSENLTTAERDRVLKGGK